jgi:hypothetical protein
MTPGNRAASRRHGTSGHGIRRSRDRERERRLIEERRPDVVATEIIEQRFWHLRPPSLSRLRSRQPSQHGANARDHAMSRLRLPGCGDRGLRPGT